MVAFTFSAFVGCSSGPNGSNSSTDDAGTQEVEFWTMQLQPDYTDYFNQLISNFEAENPGTTIRWVDVPWGDMQSKILTAVSAGTAPDIVNLNPDFASQLASRNAWLALDDRIPTAEQDQYLPGVWRANALDGETFGLPWYLTTNVTIYNTDLLDQAGVSEPPSTFEELATVAKQVKDTTGKYAFFITFVPEDSADVLQSFVKMGVPLVNDDGSAAFNTPDGTAVFQYWTDLFIDGLLPREVLTQGHRRGIELYQAGETALLATSPQFLDTVSKNAPSIATVSETAPQITGGTGAKNVAAMNLVIPQSTDQPDAALQFALYVTNPENQLAFSKAANVLPSTSDSLTDPYFAEVPSDPSPGDRARVVSASQMADAEVLIPAMEDIKLLQKIIYTNLQAAMLEQKTVDEAIADAEQEWNNR
ncbi:MAG: sugar ABC transporter substrate-binding protein [Cyanobacteria bacterium J06626_14]